MAMLKEGSNTSEKVLKGLVAEKHLKESNIKEPFDQSFHIKVTKTMKNKIDRIANKEMMPVSNVLRRALYDLLKKYEE